MYRKILLTSCLQSKSSMEIFKQNLNLKVPRDAFRGVAVSLYIWLDTDDSLNVSIHAIML